MGWVLASGAPLPEGRRTKQQLHELAQWQLRNSRARVPFTTKTEVVVSVFNERHCQLTK